MVVDWYAFILKLARYPGVCRKRRSAHKKFLFVWCRQIFSLMFIFPVIDGFARKALTVNLHHDTTQQTEGKWRKVWYYSQTNIQTAKYLHNAFLILLRWNQSEWLEKHFCSWSTMKDRALSVLHGIYSISYLCNRNSMNAMNNEICYAESVVTSLKVSSCFLLVIMWKDSNSFIPFCHCILANSNHCFNSYPKSLLIFSLFSDNSLCLWQAAASKESSAVWAAFAGCWQPTHRWVSWYHSWI